uniref:epidermal growth factor receptor kinase substrate 8-like protein 3 n=1 Tax=Euleptes europaea TaxID=460621 RepID=UPI002540CCC8|nr:epidermal growth factor receptor kinase substrate 8-like protein 3 [Euleptes europaea]
MADHYGYGENIYYSASESSFNGISGMTRPSGKAIYRQRKEYIESMINKQHEFQHRVEHLLTSYVDGKDICNVENCMGRLKLMIAQGQVWGQDMLLKVKNQNLLLTDIEAEEELDSYPLEHVQECACILDSCIYNSILAITVKEVKLHRTSIMLFQCEEMGAQLMKTKLEKVIEELRDEQQSQHVLRNNLENMLHQHSQASFRDSPYRHVWDKRAGLPMEPDGASARSKTSGQWQEQHPWEEILNHILNDIEIFIEKLQQTSYPLGDKKKKKTSKKNKHQKTLPPEPEFKDCFQKIKYSFNLLAMLEHSLQQPSAQDLLHLIFSTLSTILSSCPWTKLASMVDSPLLIPEAISLLKRFLNLDEQATWKSLGDAWSLTRSEYPNGESIPPYNPVFSDGWIPPTPHKKEASLDLNKALNRSQNTFSDRASYSPQLVQATCEFHARNPRELTIMKGDVLEVLDQQKKWWLARNTAGEKGYIPNNILEPVDQKAPKGNSMGQVGTGIPDLQPTSTPAEVTAWLRLRGFSNMTVKSLGVLNGNQLLTMSQKDLTTVCPEEGRRVFFKLSAVKLMLELYEGM